jgi:hypothetical protein
MNDMIIFKLHKITKSCGGQTDSCLKWGLVVGVTITWLTDVHVGQSYLDVKVLRALRSGQ